MYLISVFLCYGTEFSPLNDLRIKRLVYLEDLGEKQDGEFESRNHTANGSKERAAPLTSDDIYF